MPHRMFSGDSCGYDPATGTLYPIHDEVGIPHLAALMGGPELAMELTPLIDQPQWTDATVPREALADWMTSKENPYFARAAVNRVWWVLFGLGIVEQPLPLEQ